MILRPVAHTGSYLSPPHPGHMLVLSGFLEKIHHWANACAVLSAWEALPPPPQASCFSPSRA